MPAEDGSAPEQLHGSREDEIRAQIHDACGQNGDGIARPRSAAGHFAGAAVAVVLVGGLAGLALPLLIAGALLLLTLVLFSWPQSVAGYHRLSGDFAWPLRCYVCDSQERFQNQIHVAQHYMSQHPELDFGLHPPAAPGPTSEEPDSPSPLPLETAQPQGDSTPSEQERPGIIGWLLLALAAPFLLVWGAIKLLFRIPLIGILVVWIVVAGGIFHLDLSPGPDENTCSADDVGCDFVSGLLADGAIESFKVTDSSAGQTDYDLGFIGFGSDLTMTETGIEISFPAGEQDTADAIGEAARTAGYVPIEDK